MNKNNKEMLLIAKLSSIGEHKSGIPNTQYNCPCK